MEFQRSKENPKLDEKLARKKEEALKMEEKLQAKDQGDDYERKQFWKYSAESAEAWEKKMAKKAARANNGFTGRRSFLFTLSNILLKKKECRLYAACT